MENEEQQNQTETLYESGPVQTPPRREAFDTHAFEHDEPERRFPRWFLIILIILIILILFWGGSFLLGKLGIFNKSAKITKNNPTPTVCPTKVICSLVRVPARCKIIQPSNPCVCPTAYVCPNAK